MDRGCKRAITIWHRRCGKDKTWFNYMVKRAYQEKGTYYYFFPTFTQGEKILWRGMDRDGFKFIDHCPQGIRKSTNNTKMLIELDNGSVIQIIGTDNIDNIVGTNPRGCVFSEYPLQDPKAWGFIRPILAENGGWAVFNYTPRGKMNHGFDLYNLALEDPFDFQTSRGHWFSEILTADDTKIIAKEILEQEHSEILKQYGDDSLYWQEYFCSFEASVLGAYYAKQLQLAEKEKRITSVPYEVNAKVDTWWDLGVGDATAIWFTQNVGKEIHIIDYLEATGEGLAYYVSELQKKAYIYGTHNAPHDIQQRELGSGVTRLETARKLGINFQVVKNISIDDGIDASRMILNRCWFDATKCKQGLNALGSYHKEFDDKRREYKNSPYHDWSSHGSDAFRYFAVGHKSSPIITNDQRFYLKKQRREQGYSLKMV